jgi:hypothetical protein
MKHFLVCIIFLACFFCHSLAAGKPSLSDLVHTMEQIELYDQAKLKMIESLKKSWYASDNNSPANTFKLAEQLYNEYKIFNYDSAYLFVGKMKELAIAINDPELINSTKLKYAFILLSAGLYRETYDTLLSVKITSSPSLQKAEYYTLMARYYYDLATYENDKYHSLDYNTIAIRYIDSALFFYPAGSFENNYYSGLKYFKEGKAEFAISFFEKLMADSTLPDHELALTASTLGAVYLQNGETNKAIDLLVLAAIADIHTSTKETVAIYNLAELLYKKGEGEYASLCIENAIADAEFYNARQRKAQLSGIFSLIESERIHGIEVRRIQAVQYGIVATVFFVALAVLIVLMRKQVKKLQAAKKIITNVHAMQQQVNDKLEEANKIKEEYIGFFFKIDSEYFGRLKKLKNMIEQKLSERKYEEIRFIVSNIQPKKEKEELLMNFDKVFLRIFPNFVTFYNSLFKEEDQVKLAPNELLNTDLRIFALIRIGITDNEKIAEILEYSINTIYSYKTRIKNKSIIANDDFEKKIMEIKSV